MRNFLKILKQLVCIHKYDNFMATPFGARYYCSKCGKWDDFDYKQGYKEWKKKKKKHTL
jgi:hypothetical protein